MKLLIFIFSEEEWKPFPKETISITDIKEWDSTRKISIKIDQQKDLERYTKVTSSIYLYDENEEVIVLTQFVWQFKVGNVWSGTERYYLKAAGEVGFGKCEKQKLLNGMNEFNLGSFDHILTIDFNSQFLFTITVPEQNVKQELDMFGECDDIQKWLEVTKKARSVKVKMAVDEDTDYFETFSVAYKVEAA